MTFSITNSLITSWKRRAVWALALGVCSLFGQNVEDLRLTVGRSIVLDYPTDIRQISTSDPAVVDAIAVTTREILLHAKATGPATVVVWSKDGQRTIYSIQVEQNLEPVRQLLKETFPGEDITLQATRDALSLTGRVSSKEQADRAVALVSGFGKSIVNNLQIAQMVDKQIVLKVRFAEINRAALAAFGVNILSTGMGNTIGRTTTGQFAAPTASELNSTIGANARGFTSQFTITDALNVFAFRPDLNLGAFIRALQQENLLQILAEPNLVTANGREASFLVGGEFPIPVLQGGGNSNAVTIQFREFGIRLTFTPVLTENNTIKMYVKPEVSTIDLNNAISISGFLIPALSTRRMETNVELGPGQSFVIGGLLDDRATSNMSKIPGLGDIPLLGQLFKSREERKSRNELLVMVTPEITAPLNPGDPKPEITFPREFLKPLEPSERSKAAAEKEEKSAKREENPGETKEFAVRPVARIERPETEALETGGTAASSSEREGSADARPGQEAAADETESGEAANLEAARTEPAPGPADTHLAQAGKD